MLIEVATVSLRNGLTVLGCPSRRENTKFEHSVLDIKSTYRPLGITTITQDIQFTY
jgi:hypothetical protein